MHGSARAGAARLSGTPDQRRAAESLLCAEVGALAIGRHCARCGSARHGRPVARMSAADGPRAWVSISYAEGLVAVAWSWAGPVGVDVEVTGPPVDLGDEAVTRREWTRREAALKAGGPGPARTLELPSGYVGTLVGAAAGHRVVRRPT